MTVGVLGVTGLGYGVYNFFGKKEEEPQQQQEQPQQQPQEPQPGEKNNFGDL